MATPIVRRFLFNGPGSLKYASSLLEGELVIFTARETEQDTSPATYLEVRITNSGIIPGEFDGSFQKIEAIIYAMGPSRSMLRELIEPKRFKGYYNSRTRKGPIGISDIEK